MAAMEQLIVYNLRCKISLKINTETIELKSGLTAIWEMTMESPWPIAKLAHVGRFGSHLNTETTSHVSKQSGWMEAPRQELWTDPEHRM